MCGAAALCACGQPAARQAPAPAAPPPAAPAASSAPVASDAPPLEESSALPVTPASASTSASPEAQAIDAAAYPAAAADKTATMRMLIKAEVLLDRARFSPGVIDGKTGGNLHLAVAAFEQAHGLAVDGALDPQVWTALTQADSAPVMQDYTITAADVAGPFIDKVPTTSEAMAKLDHLSYTGPVEALAEKFHMDEALLKSVNPDATFAAGSTIVVVVPRSGKLASVARIEVDKTNGQLRAYGADDALVATYPATVGSTSRPAPSGEWAVNTVAPNPTWNYDSSRLTFASGKKQKFQIAAGPNNPVGSMWIDLTKDTYGIHGTPDPRLVGKTASHGCVRLTNWDANELGAAVKKGTKVVFVGAAAKVPAARKGAKA